MRSREECTGNEYSVYRTFIAFIELHLGANITDGLFYVLLVDVSPPGETPVGVKPEVLHILRPLKRCRICAIVCRPTTDRVQLILDLDQAYFTRNLGLSLGTTELSRLRKTGILRCCRERHPMMALRKSLSTVM